jgi:hypothetical protein
MLRRGSCKCSENAARAGFGAHAPVAVQHERPPHVLSRNAFRFTASANAPEIGGIGPWLYITAVRRDQEHTENMESEVLDPK